MSVKRGLGRGLDALFGDNFQSDKNTNIEVKHDNIEKTSIVKKNNFDDVKDVILELPLHFIIPNINQPRKLFNDEALIELTNSIRIHGIITPIVVVKKEKNKYMIIAGERRFRACQKAGISTIPCIIKNYTEKNIKEISLIDNLQRENLNPIETANAIKELMNEYNYTQEAVAERIGKSRSNVTNILRLLTLSPIVVEMINNNNLSSGHARCLVSIQNENKQIELANKCVKDDLSVREFELLVKNYFNPIAIKKPLEKSIELVELVNNMKRVFGTKVSIVGNDKKGRISIDYFSKDDLDRFVELVKKLQ